MLQSSFARRVRRDPRFRPLGVAAYRLFAQVAPTTKGPKVLANSLPKAGTHLLMSLLDAVPGMRFSGLHFAYGEVNDGVRSSDLRSAELGKQLSRLRPSQYMTGHVRHRSDVTKLLNDNGYRTILILRDPRAVALSAAMYLASNRRHPLHRRVMSEFPDRDDRIQAVITGIPPTATSEGRIGLAERLDRYTGWLDEPGVCIVRYEELVGPLGGGGAQEQLAAVKQLLAFLGLSQDDALATGVADSVYSTTGATFRRGQIDSWREELGYRHQVLIESTCAQQMHKLGYLPAGM